LHTEALCEASGDFEPLILTLGHLDLLAIRVNVLPLYV
jgi:hypothetical protein